MMRIPVIQGVIDRRILANFRVRPDALERILPPPFRPKLVEGWGVAGICLIRLKQIRPRGLPGFIGVSSENAAHRIAVQWDVAGQTREGVFVPRRDSSSRLNALAGGRVFPGVHHRASFDVHETDTSISLKMHGNGASVAIDAMTDASFPATSIFRTLELASEFFRSGSVGYSPASRVGEFDGLELRTPNWRVEPLDVKSIHSSFFGDAERFPAGSVHFDCALLMRGVQHEWHGREPICCTSAAA